MRNKELCENCGGTNIITIETGYSKIYEVVRRRHECVDCNYRFTTLQIHLEDYEELIKITRNIDESNRTEVGMDGESN